MNVPTGVRLLDHLMEGGLPGQSQVLLYGASFLGKEALSRHVLLTNMAKGVPGIVVLTKETAADAKQALASIDKGFARYEQQGLAWFVDTYSRSVGAEEPARNVVYTDTPVDLNSLSVAINGVQARIVREHDHHLLLVDSASTLVLYSNAATTFRFLQILTGKAKRAGATTLVLLDEGMHADAEVQMFRHLADGVLAVRGESGKQQILVEGLGVSRNPGWLDYRFDKATFEVTGSLAGGRIR